MSKTKKETIHVPEGLILRRPGEALETVNTKSSVFRLLNNNANFEITQVDLEPDARVFLTPAGLVSETFFVLSGELECQLGETREILSNGSYIVTKSLVEPAILSALTASSLLYITEQPQFHELSNDMRELRNLAVEIELKDGYTADHCGRLQDLSFAVGHELGLSSNSLKLLDYGAYLHDVGKISVPLSILNKPAKLTPEEWEVIKKHPTFGREMLDQTFMKEAGVIVEQHHERFDGSGYPYGLSGSDLMIEASIVAVADTFDAMTTDRPYRKASTPAEALAEISRFSGIHYPQEVVRAFCSALKTGKIIAKK